MNRLDDCFRVQVQDPDLSNLTYLLCLRHLQQILYLKYLPIQYDYEANSHQLSLN